MPLFDAYTGPYKHKHRYWTGLLLLVRVVLLTVFSLNQTNNPSINLLTIALMVFVLLAYLSFIGGVYKNLVCNTLEISFVLNVGVASVAALYQPLSGNDTALIATILTGVAFSIFVVIVVGHAVQRLLLSRKLQIVQIKRMIAKTRIRDRKKAEEQIENVIKADDQGITHTSIELCEPLIS